MLTLFYTFPILLSGLIEGKVLPFTSTPLHRRGIPPNVKPSPPLSSKSSKGFRYALLDDHKAFMLTAKLTNVQSYKRSHLKWHMDGEGSRWGSGEGGIAFLCSKLQGFKGFIKWMEDGFYKRWLYVIWRKISMEIFYDLLSFFFFPWLLVLLGRFALYSVWRIWWKEPIKWLLWVQAVGEKEASF